MGSYENDTDVLDRELRRVLAVFDSVTDDEWARPTLLVPWDAGQPHWTVFELAGHFDISIGLTRMLIADPSNGQPGRDRVSFFIFPRSEVAPGVYDYAYTMVEGKEPGDMPGALRETFTRTIEESRANPPALVGSGYYALMELGEFVPSRIVEAVVHGFDLTDALGRETIASREASRSPRASWTSCSPGAPSPAARPISPTTWRGFAPRQGGRRTTIRACR